MELYNQLYMFPQEGLVVDQIPISIAAPFVSSIHYSRLLPQNTVRTYGLYRGEWLIGVVAYGIPASPSLCVGVAGEAERQNVLELNRLAILPEENGGNMASFLVGKSLKYLPNHTFVVSYADTGWGHVGYVYQACNFLYTGCTKERTDFYSGEGKHSRHYDKNETRRKTRTAKHRYVYLVGTKRDRKQMLSELRYPIMPYPKGDTVRYDVENPQMVKPIEVTGAWRIADSASGLCGGGDG